jgi:glycosyltransferase involved in cell wall biosynthesis
MISVLTLTYKRPVLLQEAIASFLEQDIEAEMVIVNDNPEATYLIDNPRIRVINCKERFPSLSDKLEFGFKECKFDFVYRLDDDDLLAPNGLKYAKESILNNPDYDIYRSQEFYFFVHNVFDRITSNVNTGNIYTKTYINNIKFPKTSWGEDVDITYGNKGKIYQSPNKTMIYRWGMNTSHVSGLGEMSNEDILKNVDRILGDESGFFNLEPIFQNNYYSQLPK